MVVFVCPISNVQHRESQGIVSVAAQAQRAGFPHPADNLHSRGLQDGVRERPAEVRGARPFPLACLTEPAVCLQGHGSFDMLATATASAMHRLEHENVVVFSISLD